MQAQEAGDGAVQGVSAVTMGVGSGKEILVVFKEVENIDHSSDAQDFQKVTAIAAYDFVGGAGGSGRGKLALVASRFIDYDLRLVNFNADQSREETTYAWARKTYTEVKDMLKGKEPKDPTRKTGK